MFKIEYGLTLNLKIKELNLWNVVVTISTENSN